MSEWQPMDTAPTDRPFCRIRELFEHDIKAGHLIWRPRPVEQFETVRDASAWNTRYAGTVAGYINGNGYRLVSMDGKRWPAHRLIWIYANGPIPPGMQIDHINGVRSDNRLANLRIVTHAENGRNSSMRITNTSGVMGVCWHKATRKWLAKIRVNGRHKHIGLFDTIEAAAAARATAESEYGFHPGHGKVLGTRNAPSH